MEANVSKTTSVTCGAILICTLVLAFTPVLSAQTAVLEKLPYSGGVLMSRAIRAGRVQLHSNGGNQVTNPDLTCTPAPCVYTPVRASEGGQPVNENPVAANPANAMNLLSGANDYNCSTLQGFFSSSDGGSTWSHTCLPLYQSGAFGEGDPIVGFDTNGVAYAGGIQSGNYVVASSTNGGVSFGTPVVAAKAILGYLADKPWLEIDTGASSPHKNTLYVSGTQFASNSNSEISVSHSSDGGKTWVTKAVDTEQVFPTEVDQFSDLAIGGDGTVYVNWLRCPANGTTGDCGGTVSKIMFSKSTDGGNTWSAATAAATITLLPDGGGGFYGTLPNFPSERISNLASNAVSGSGATAKVYLSVYTWTGTQAQVLLVTSANGGTTWGAPVIVSSIPKGDQWFQWVNVSAGPGKIAVTWLDRRNDSANKLYQPFFAVSSNGGTSFGAAHALSASKSNPANDGFGGAFMGDYRTHVWNGKAVDAVWMDTTTGVTNCQDEFGGVLLK